MRNITGVARVRGDVATAAIGINACPIGSSNSGNWWSSELNEIRIAVFVTIELSIHR